MSLISQPDLSGRVALVTGGSPGIGASTCQALVQNGARVAVNGLDFRAVDDFVGEIVKDGGVSLAAPGDATGARAIV
jgi:NAD(P)-dependent dehydrogenase (short-subunit alcohol dehydrogenase family)